MFFSSPESWCCCFGRRPFWTQTNPASSSPKRTWAWAGNGESVCLCFSLLRNSMVTHFRRCLGLVLLIPPMFSCAVMVPAAVAVAEAVAVDVAASVAEVSSAATASCCPSSTAPSQSFAPGSCPALTPFAAPLSLDTLVKAFCAVSPRLPSRLGVHVRRCWTSLKRACGSRSKKDLLSNERLILSHAHVFAYFSLKNRSMLGRPP